MWPLAPADSRWELDCAAVLEHTALPLLGHKLAQVPAISSSWAAILQRFGWRTLRQGSNFTVRDSRSEAGRKRLSS